MSSEANLLPEGIEAELFRGHSVTVLLLGFIHNCRDMITVDSTGRVIVWKYTRYTTVANDDDDDDDAGGGDVRAYVRARRRRQLCSPRGRSPTTQMQTYRVLFVIIQ